MITTDDLVFWDIFTREIDSGSTVAAAEEIATQNVVSVESNQEDFAEPEVA